MREELSLQEFLSILIVVYVLRAGQIVQGVPKKKVTILNGYNFFNIYGRYMKQKSTERRDFKIL